MKLKQQFIILLTIFIVIPSMLTVFISSFLFKDKAEELVKNNIITASTDKAGKIHSYYEQIKSNLDFIGDMQALSEFMTVNSDSITVSDEVSNRYAENRKFISSMIYEHKNRTPFIIGIFVANKNDVVLLCDDVSFLNKNIDFVKGIDSVSKGQYVVSTVLGSKNYYDIMTTCISTPIFIENEYMGYITAIISPEYYESVVGLENFFETGSVTLVAPDDSILATGSDIFSNSITNLPVNNTFVTQWKNINFEETPNGIIEFQIDGKDKFGYYIFLENVGVKIVCNVNASEISNNIISILFIAFGCIIVVTAFVIIVSMLYLNKFIFPIVELTGAVRDFSNGNTKVHIIESGKNEFSELAREFNLMVSKISASCRDLSDSNEEMLAISNNIKAGIFKLRVDNDFVLEYANSEFMRMIECDPDDFYDRYKDKFINTIYYQDKSRVRLQLLKKNHNNDVNEFEYRIERTDGSFIWAACQTRIVSDKHNNLFLYGCITDTTKTHNTIEHLRQYEERYRIISEQTEDIICEYDYVKDTIKYTPKWIAKFGYNIPDRNTYRYFVEASQIHPNDRQLFTSWFKSNYKKNTNKSTEFRIKNVNDEFIWVNMRTTTLFDSLDEPIKMIIILTDISARKKQIAELTQMAQIDQLTGIYNKMTAQNSIESVLAVSKENDSHALVIADVDNFKIINDNFGHLLGDNVLSELADKLKENFRNDSIVGRIGGDEFIILLKNIKSDDELNEKAKIICSIFNKTYTSGNGKINITGSIGIAKYPEHGMRFNDLYSNADSALYIAKNSGKNRYSIYNEEIKGLTYIKNFDKDIKALEVRQSQFRESFTQYIFSLLYETNDVKKTVNMILEIVGKHYHVSRVYIFENSLDNTYCKNTYEWCNIGISSEIANLQHVVYSEIDDHDKKFNNNGIFYCNDTSALPGGAKTILQEQGIVSMLHCAIKYNGVLKGYIGFDECTGRRLWTQEEINVLNFISKIIGSFLIRNNQEKSIEDRDKLIQSVIDTKDSWIYIVDGENMRLKYINKKLGSFSENIVLNDHCYLHFGNCRSAQCTECPLEKLRRDPALQKASSIINIPKLNVTTDVSATRITLSDNKEYFLMSAKYVKEQK